MTRTGSITMWSTSLDLVRDTGGDYWRLPKVQAWRMKRPTTPGMRVVAGFCVRVGWRWTAWMVSPNLIRHDHVGDL